jgi:DNA-directed RNA polymerase specialized sigma24 family protein
VSGAGHGAGRVEDLLRDLAPEVLTAVRHRYGGTEDCEDAVQEALIAAYV